MAVSVSALEKYTGAPQPPYLIYGHVSWNNQLLAGARLEITNQNTGMTKQITTDSNGYWQEESGNWLSSAAGRPPARYGDVIKVKVTDGCGTGDVCEKQFEAHSTGYIDWAEIDFSINGNLNCPPINCPSTSCGSSSCSYSEATCRDKYPCDEASCQETVCTSCPTLTCPAEKVCDECPAVDDNVCDCPESDCDSSLAYLIGVLGLVAGGLGTYYLKRKDAKMPNGTFIKFGGAGTKHLHRGIRGYHKPSVEHREKHERHPKGELDPKYEKGADGVYRYVG